MHINLPARPRSYAILSWTLVTSQYYIISLHYTVELDFYLISCSVDDCPLHGDIDFPSVTFCVRTAEVLGGERQEQTVCVARWHLVAQAFPTHRPLPNRLAVHPTSLKNTFRDLSIEIHNIYVRMATVCVLSHSVFRRGIERLKRVP